MSQVEANFNVAKLRREFPQLRKRIGNLPLCYFDSAATVQKPRIVVDELNHCLQKSYANVHRAAHSLATEATSRFEAARAEVAEFIRGEAKECIFTKGTTDAINLVAQSWGNLHVQEGDEILLTQAEHHANIVPWQLLAQRTGAKIVFAKVDEWGCLDVADWLSKLGANTKLVAFGHASNVTGAVNPVAALTEAAKSNGSKVLIDGAQAVAHLSVDVHAIGCDFYVFSGHKLYGPNGIGVLWGRYPVLCEMPAVNGGGEMISEVTEDGFTTQLPPLRFEPGTPAWPEACALAVAIQWLNIQRSEGLASYEFELYGYLRLRLAELSGFRVLGADQPNVGIASLVSDDAVQDLGFFLDQQGIAVRVGHHCAMPLMKALGVPGTLRISLAAYNTRAEIDHLIECLAQWEQQVSRARSRVFSLTELTAAKALNAEAIAEYQGLIGDSSEESFRALIHLGQSSSRFDETVRATKYLVPGCETRLWLAVVTTVPTLQFAVDAESDTMRGLLSLLSHELQGKTGRDLADFHLDQWVERLALSRFVTATRGNGVNAVVAALSALYAAGDKG
ncbi:aminotransferase class V-fold PLP-dependent enzyme [Umboniibacter marinipuniceus]|uniref:cysteine desulfurase n=1 Tax=Umboniibacter marinipuniceus TaxID=569599 RepID=A0A3M0A6H3_9GAMM|nr:aminotransferase class V-fold PLP-dependent enzyme [Umboniibacter marinipuniceus]RMA80187.1 cysteine desulfurase [Umboniibacter marinipuniceus]